eukprot:921616-Pelagomonas_calceolata.AAC.3
MASSCVCLSWLLCTVINVLHHLPCTDWLTVVGSAAACLCQSRLCGSSALAVPSKHFAYQPTVCGCRFLPIATIATFV